MSYLYWLIGGLFFGIYLGNAKFRTSVNSLVKRFFNWCKQKITEQQNKQNRAK